MGYKNTEQQREYQRQWMANRRAAYLADKACIVCGCTDDLEVDHVDRSLKISHRIWSWSNERRDAELSKCQILCKTHHAEKTSIEKSRPITHGNSGYDRGCRCTECYYAHSERMKMRKR